MSKTSETSASKTDETKTVAPQKADCCGGGDKKDQRAQAGTKEQVNTSDATRTGHTSHVKSGSGCCGGGKAHK